MFFLMSKDNYKGLIFVQNIIKFVQKYGRLIFFHVIKSRNWHKYFAIYLDADDHSRRIFLCNEYY